jgi:predicted nucleic acid-binding protein
VTNGVTDVFADTSYYIALLNRLDVDHGKATTFRHGYSGRYLTTAFVVIELGNWLCRTAQRPLFVRLVDALGADPSTTVLPGTEDPASERSYPFYRNRLDQEWSLTDCISFEVMRQMRITHALTADHHFEQAGFFALLK